jgi:hypothetical protein
MLQKLIIHVTQHYNILLVGSVEVLKLNCRLSAGHIAPGQGLFKSVEKKTVSYRSRSFFFFVFPTALIPRAWFRGAGKLLLEGGVVHWSHCTKRKRTERNRNHQTFVCSLFTRSRFHLCCLNNITHYMKPNTIYNH